MNWTETTRCEHGIPFSDQCDYCEIVGLKESLAWMTRRVKRNEERLALLLEKTSPFSSEDSSHE